MFIVNTDKMDLYLSHGCLISTSLKSFYISLFLHDFFLCVKVIFSEAHLKFCFKNLLYF